MMCFVSQAFARMSIVKFISSNLPIETLTFVELGVEGYTESNTRFLFVKFKGPGLVIDGNSRHIDYVWRGDVSRLFDLRSMYAFVTAENIDELLIEAGLIGEIGLLSIDIDIDIDGVDYLVWRAITGVDTAIVVVECNVNLGSERPVTVSYHADFDREKKHPQWLCWDLACGTHSCGASERLRLHGLQREWQ